MTALDRQAKIDRIDTILAEIASGAKPSITGKINTLRRTEMVDLAREACELLGLDYGYEPVRAAIAANAARPGQRMKYRRMKTERISATGDRAETAPKAE